MRSKKVWALPIFLVLFACQQAEEKEAVTAPESTAPEATATPQAAATGEQLTGDTAASTDFGSGWLNLAPARNFSEGDHLRIHVGGTATQVLVRLLPKGVSPDSKTGLMGEAIDVPANRIIELVLETEHRDVDQISVHGGTHAWGIGLGETNGPATVERVELVRGR